jgi:hypothetical protein
VTMAASLEPEPLMRGHPMFLWHVSHTGEQEMPEGPT